MPRALSAQARITGSTASRAAGASASRSSIERTRQKWSSPASSSGVMKRRQRRDDGALRLEQPGGVLDGDADGRLHGQAAAGLQQQADAQALQRALLPPSPATSRSPAAAAPCCRARQAAQHLHQQRGVGHGARHGAGGAAHGQVDRHPAQAGLEADHAAPRGGRRIEPPMSVPTCNGP